MHVARRIMTISARLDCVVIIALALATAGVGYGGEYYTAVDRSEGRGRMLWSSNFYIDGRIAEPGDEVCAFNEAGIPKGYDTVIEAGIYGFMDVSGTDGDVISFRVVSKSRKREYVSSSSYVMSGASWQYDSLVFDIVTGPEYDSDGDGMCDYWEWYYRAGGFNPDSVNDPSVDTDSDGLTDIEEYRADTDPTSADTDGDGFSDSVEVGAGSDPNAPLSIPGAISINFGPAGCEIPPSYCSDNGFPWGARGYGWTQQ